MPFGKRTRDSAMWPFRTRVKRSFISFEGRPIATVRLTVEIGSREALARGLEKLGRVRGTISVQRHSE
mgnify:CR=1 FL=1